MFQEKGVLISISFIFLLAGLIMYYVTSKFRKLEGTIAKQNDILSDFIINVRQEIGGAPIGGAPIGGAPIGGAPIGGAVENGTKKILLSGPASNDATVEAKFAAESYHATKIEVSDAEDDADDECDSESDSESDSDDESVGEPSPVNLSLDNSEVNTPLDDVTVIDVVSNPVNEDELNLPELSEIDIANDGSNIKAIKLSDVIGDMVGDVGLVEDVGLADVSLNKPSTIVSSNDVSTVLPFKKRKVEDLRKIVLEHNLTVPSEANKMKKADLLTLIETNHDKLV
jgi:hypothetical protein